jgi:hypothetical protein
MKYLLIVAFVLFSVPGYGQKLKLKHRPSNSLGGSAFSESIRNNSLSLDDRELMIFKQIRSGNIPAFYRKLTAISDTAVINDQQYTIRYFVLPDFIAIGSDEDYFYCPMRPQLAQKVANRLKCTLPTRKISDRIYQSAAVKMIPEPIPPSKEMITVPVFERHNLMVHRQREDSFKEFPPGSLVAGNKKDVVISNKISESKAEPKVVIYGWHKPDGKAIQPLYSGHSTLHVDYSHGIRLIQKKVWVNGRRSTIKKVLRSDTLHSLLSDEGIIREPIYPLK